VVIQYQSANATRIGTDPRYSALCLVSLFCRNQSLTEPGSCQDATVLSKSGMLLIRADVGGFVFRRQKILRIRRYSRASPALPSFHFGLACVLFCVAFRYSHVVYWLLLCWSWFLFEAIGDGVVQWGYLGSGEFRAGQIGFKFLSFRRASWILQGG